MTNSHYSTSDIDHEETKRLQPFFSSDVKYTGIAKSDYKKDDIELKLSYSTVGDISLEDKPGFTQRKLNLDISSEISTNFNLSSFFNLVKKLNFFIIHFSAFYNNMILNNFFY